MNGRRAGVPAPANWDRVALVFGVALGLRLLVAAAFFGSIDVANSVRDARTAVDRVPVYLPYFPVVANMLFGVGLVVSTVAVPLGMAIKFVPCVSDALLAAWFLVDPGLSADQRRRCAWFYATCPLSLVLVSLHGQWDALWLLPMVVALAVADASGPSGPGRTALLLGALAAVAVLFKPVPVALLPAVVPSIRRLPLRAWVASAGAVVAAFGAVLGGSLLWFAYEGFDVGRVLSSIRDYGATARTVVVMGLPRLGEPAGGLPTGLGLSVAEYRLLGMVLAGLLLLRYHLWPERQGRFITAAAVCLVLQGVGGIAPQYLLWPLPFVVATGRLRAATWYAAAASLFLAAYYLVPEASVLAGENLGLFVPLDAVGWLAPPRAVTDVFDGGSVLRAWRVVANAALPLALLAFTLYLLLASAWRREGERAPAGGVSLSRAAAWASPPVLVVTLCAVLYVTVPVHGRGGRFDEVLPRRLAQYAAVPPTLGPAPAEPPPGGPWPTSGPVLLGIGTVAWAVWSDRRARRPDDPGAAPLPALGAVAPEHRTLTA